MKGEGGGAPGGQVNGMPNKKSQSTSKLSAKGELQVYNALESLYIIYIFIFIYIDIYVCKRR